jgi:hypothetical protein
MQPQRSKAAFWIGWVLSILPALFLLFDAIAKLVKPQWVVDPTVKLGFSEDVIVPLGVVLLVSTLLYLLPLTTGLGAILLTGYLGGAVAAHVRHWEGWFGVFFPVVFGVILWIGLVLREPRLRLLVPGAGTPASPSPGESPAFKV